MLLNDFYTITELRNDEGVLTCTICVNSDHEILKAHFPQQAVVPGVVMLTMMQEILEIEIGKTLQLSQASMIKFLQMFTPPQQTTATFVMRYQIGEQVLLDASLQDQETTFMKCKITYNLI